jgi:predicted outer membrane repeat protein
MAWQHVWRGWMRRWLAPRRRPVAVRPWVVLALERLEDRLTPSGLNLMVTDATDSATDTGSLRYAINQVNADTTKGDSDFISFSPSLANAAILLGSGLTLSNTTANLTITIDGSAAAGVTIAGTGFSFSLLTVDMGVTANLTALTINDGLAASGGGINNAGTLTLDGCLMSENTATANGGAIFNSGTLTISAIGGALPGSVVATV